MAAAGYTRSCGGPCWPRAWSGRGKLEQADVVLAQLRAGSGQVSYLAPALAWLDGWLAEQRGDPEQALEIYSRGEDTADPQSPVTWPGCCWPTAGCCGVPETGGKRSSGCGGRATLYQALRAGPFLARTEEELAACRLPGSPAKKQQSVLALTNRETEVAHLVGKGLSNPEVAAELFISRKAVEYHLGNIYAKCGLQGRQELRRFVGQWHQPTVV